MKNLFLSLFFSLLLVGSGHAQTTYRPDTLDFATFLNQCQEFSRGNRQELWVVTFWASWNSNSLYQLPMLKSMAANYQDKPIRFFFLSRDTNRDIWQETIYREQLGGTNVLISQAEDYEYLKQGFQHNSLPATFLVDANGNIYRIDRTQQLNDMLYEESRKLPDNMASTTTYPANTPTRPSTATPNRPTNGTSGSTTATPPPASTTQNGYLIHTVRKTETLYSISRQYSVSVQDIQRLNSLSGNVIKIGQELKIKRQ
ncbi:MAG: LysM peptidoglycan-binding domain-containing protein [Bacteroidia bacterium]|nr:LysM peptidoglycan-binding domain-containing protein [Bacteroidia bacterium]